MKKKTVVTENYLERTPLRADAISWSTNEAGSVTLAVKNEGVFNRIAQRLFKKPKISYVHLDEMGSFIWPLLDGEKSILDIGKKVEERFGENAHPLYERLAKYFQILESYHFILWKKDM
ncbi:MAG: PqqD family protein [Ruminococcaceae bacterium]|nr:PqqD family protein [Oscillospiraceae bacterium]